MGTVLYAKLAAWIFSVMVAMVPPEKVAEAPKHHGFAVIETPEEAEARMRVIASDIAAVAANPKAPQLFVGEDAVAKTALMLTVISYFESMWSAQIDKGNQRGDAGRSVCLMQIQVGQGTVRVGKNSWDAFQLLAERRRCLRAGLELLNRSFWACKGDIAQQLTAYATGRCGKGRKYTLLRQRSFEKRWAMHPWKTFEFEEKPLDLTGFQLMRNPAAP